MIGGQTAPDDWLVRCNGQGCGRVVKVHAPHSESRSVWSWVAWSYPGAHGRCDSFDEALENVRRTVIAAGGKMSGKHQDIDL